MIIVLVVVYVISSPVIVEVFGSVNVKVAIGEEFKVIVGVAGVIVYSLFC